MEALINSKLKVVEIVDIFNLVRKKEKVDFKLNEIYEQKTKIQVKDENGNLVAVKGLMVKEAPIYKITFDDGEVLEAADRHLLHDKASNDCYFLNQLSVGEKIIDANDKERTIVEIENLDKVDLVYDLSIDTDSHLYQTENGLIHHNTFNSRSILTQELGSKGGKWVEKGGSMSAIGLYSYLYRNNGKVILFDDLTGPLDEKESLDILKKALDSNEPRTVSYNKMNIGKGELEDIPDEFDFTGRIIFVTNKKFSEINSAVKSRAKTVNVDLSAEQTIDLVQSKLKNFLPNVPMKTKQDVLDYLLEMVQSGVFKGKLNFRVVEDAVATWICSGASMAERKQWIYFSLKSALDTK